MCTTRIIKQTTKISLQPSELGDVYGAIRQYLQELVNTSISDGYILSIPRIHNYKNNIIHNTTACCLIDVTYDVEIIRPKVDEIYTCMVHSIFKEGVFVQLYQINILISGHTLQQKQWKYSCQRFIHEDGKILEKGNWVQVQIKSIRYEDNVYQCLGTIV